MLGDPAYDTNSIINYAKKLGIKTVILPKSKRKSKQNFDSALYHLHHIVENIFLKFKPLRSIATRYFRQRSHKKRIKNKSKKDGRDKNRIKSIITSKNFSKTFQSQEISLNIIAMFIKVFIITPR